MTDQVDQTASDVVATVLDFAANENLVAQEDYAALRPPPSVYIASASIQALVCGNTSDILILAEQESYSGLPMNFTNAIACRGSIRGDISKIKAILLVIVLVVLYPFWVESHAERLCTKEAQAPLTDRTCHATTPSIAMAILARIVHKHLARAPQPALLFCLAGKHSWRFWSVAYQTPFLGCLAASLSAPTMTGYALTYLTAGILSNIWCWWDFGGLIDWTLLTDEMTTTASRRKNMKCRPPSLSMVSQAFPSKKQDGARLFTLY